MKYNYYTQDGHLMQHEEVMWRICCSKGEPFLEPVSVIFHHGTGYNGDIVRTSENEFQLKYRLNLNPFAANHLHYFSKENAQKALRQLNG